MQGKLNVFEVARISLHLGKMYLLKYLLLVFVLVFSASSCDDGMEEVEVTYSSGKIKAKGKMYNGIEHGAWVRYYENGQKESEGVFDMGAQDGVWKWWYASGQLREKSTFIINDATGKSVRYYEDGSVRAEDFWKEDIKIGTAKAFHPNGKVNYIGKFLDGLKDSTWILHYDNGQVEDSVRYDWGNEVGLGVKYYRNGNRMEFGQWRSGFKYGIWRYYYEDGSNKLQGEFSDRGWRDGKWIYYDSLAVSDSIVVYSQGYIDTVYKVTRDTLDFDSVKYIPSPVIPSVEETEEGNYSFN